MIEHLYIENVALIEKINIEFNKGLNILSGETGAGKSIIIDSISFASGQRPGRDFIKKNASKALVELIIFIENDFVAEEIKKLGIEIDEDSSLLISRSITSTGRTTSKINGKNVTVGMLKEVSSLLIDIHGQHEYQSLMNPSKHICIVDSFCGDNFIRLKEKLSEKYRDYKNILKNIRNIDGNEKEREMKTESYQFQIDEIEMANLRENEEDELISKRKILNNSEKLKEHSQRVLSILYRDENGSVSDRVSSALDSLFEIARLDPTQKELCSELEGIYAELEDVIDRMGVYDDSIDSNQSELEEIEERLDFLYRIKRKYGKDVKAILNYCQELKEKLDAILNSEEELIKLNEKKKNAEVQIRKICDLISEERKAAAKKIQTSIEKTLKELGMKNAEFKVDVSKQNEFTTNGRDKIEFLISPNLGEDLKPLAKIASGGEMSRVMLAMKVILADADTVETFIFDEIDTGVSGRTAQQVAQKLSDLGKKRQILCITHLPQIAAMGDSHFLIEKTFDSNKTTTNIYELDYKKIIYEIARLTGGVEITEATLKAAEEMKRLALNLK